MARKTHFFLGANTPYGFFSYYDYIISQKDATKIYCIKGGPGTGKSSFMKKIAKNMLTKGYDIEFAHCSSDDNSLDGILIKQLGIAFLDGTSPHIVDPKNPGAVDTIIHLGDFWDEEGIRENKNKIIAVNHEISNNFKRAYRYLASAKNIYDDTQAINDEMYPKYAQNSFFESMIFHEFYDLQLTKKQGFKRKLFASAISPSGTTNRIETLIAGYKTYVLKGYTGNILSEISDYAVKRGLDVEMYFCPMEPAKKCEHLLIPGLNLAFVSSNKFHSHDYGEIIEFEYEKSVFDKYSGVLNYNNEIYENLILKAVETIKQAKKLHDELESYYIPNMKFDLIDSLIDKTTKQILDKI